MAEDSDLEKTEAPSSRRLDKAREEGQVPRSRELGAFVILLVSAILFKSLGGWMMFRMAAIVRNGLSFDSEQLSDPEFVLTRFAESAINATLTFSPLVVCLVLAALFTPSILGSWNFSTKTLVPDLTKLNPISGLKRVISVRGLAELVKALGKTFLVGGTAVWILWRQREAIFSLFGLPIESALASVGAMISYSFMMIVLSMLVIVAMDVPFQLWQHYSKLKMTKEEVRKEGKEMEGNPEVKGKIRQLQREAARRRMMSAIPEADVIVTNPTHFSVALAYKSGMSAPKVLAKGAGEIALKIREIAAEHRIPTLEAPPLARALYRHAELDQEIPAGLYAAVAEVLAYIYQLSTWQKQGGTYPKPPRDIEVPKAMAVSSELEEAVNLVPEAVNG